MAEGQEMFDFRIPMNKKMDWHSLVQIFFSKQYKAAYTA